MRQQVYADAKRLHFGDAFENMRLYADLVQFEGRDEPAYASPDDKLFHFLSLHQQQQSADDGDIAEQK